MYNRANECLQNENFGLLPISIVYCILSKSEEIPNDLLFDFISKSIEERCTLFNFLNIQNLSDIKLGELFDLYDQNPNCFQYFPSNFGFLKSIITENKKMKTQLIELNEKCDKFQGYLDDACKMANFFFGGEDFFGDIFLHLGQCSERGNMLASLCIGFSYMITDDDSKKMNALPYLQKSIEQGNSYALLYIGTLYEEGECVEQSYSKAIEIYQESPSKGNLVALFKLASLYTEGKGVEQDYSKAIELYKNAAANGNSTALIRLGEIYTEGKLVEKDYSKAIDYFKQSAKLGNVGGFGFLGDLYKSGEGVEKNLAKALSYYEKAYNLCDYFPTLHEILEELKKQISESEEETPKPLKK